MNKVSILDCTLRDGGYCNGWKFGLKNIKKIVMSLVQANIDIVECGFLTNRIEYKKGISKFARIEEFKNILPEKKDGKVFVAMVNYGEYNAEDIPSYDGRSIDGIRVAFHKKDREEALTLCKEIKKKGYKVFVQPMVSLRYSDEEFLDMIHKVNDIMPNAFYIVDSFGMMKKKNLLRLFYMVEHNLSEDISIGFHSHNNMQLAYSNAQSLVETQTNRNLIVDASIYGMGRGAGNLNTELFVEYLNEVTGTSYVLKPLLIIIDDILNDFYQRNYWGYSLPNYLSAVHFVHPSYAGYFANKNTLTVETMNELFGMMDRNKSVEYDKNYAEQIYENYMRNMSGNGLTGEDLNKKFKNKGVLLIAPGKSAEEKRGQIAAFSKKKNIITVSVNFNYDDKIVDYIFVSNLRRFREIEEVVLDKCIFTSNLAMDNARYVVDYGNLLSDIESVYDNAGLMAIRLFMLLEASEIYLAGFDGYSYDFDNNYISEKKVYVMKKSVADAMNEGMVQVLKKYRNEIRIEFLTESVYLKL